MGAGCLLEEPIYFAAVEHSRAPLSLEQFHQPLSFLVAACTNFDDGHTKDGQALIPARFHTCSTPCRNYTHGGGKSLKCTGGVMHRLSANVDAMSGLMLDLDTLTSEQLADVLAGLAEDGTEYLWWNTYSHTPETPKARVFIPFDVECPINSPEQWSESIWPQLIKYFGLDGVVKADASCCDPARLYYMPRHPEGSQHHQAGYVPGARLAWREIVSSDYVPLATVTYETFGEDPSREVNLDVIREKLEVMKVPYIKQLLKGEALTPSPDRRNPGQMSRYEAWLKTTASLSMVVEGWESRAALWSLLDPSWGAEALESPNDFTQQDTIMQLLETAIESAPRRKAESEARYKAKVELASQQARKQALAMTNARSKRSPTDATPALDDAEDLPHHALSASLGLAAAAAQTEVDDGAWYDACERKTITVGKGQIAEVFANSAQTWSAVLELHPEFRGRLRMNVLGDIAELDGKPIGEHFATKLQTWLSRNLKVNPQISTLHAHVMSVANDNPYDPLVEYLDGLEWDGVPRVNNWLRKYFNCPTTDAFGRDITNHIDAVGKRWLLSAVARGYEPGCKVDTVLELEAHQGARKSTALQILGGKFYSNKPLDVRNKDGWAVLSRAWIIELGEIQTLKSDVGAQKDFLSRGTDDFRAPYARMDRSRPRRSVLAGTVNEDGDYLADSTGNRRHWPVRCGDVDTQALRRDRDQLWAEAVVLYKQHHTCADCAAEAPELCNKHRWWLSSDEEIEAAQQAQQRRPTSLHVERLLTRLLELPTASRPVEICVAQAFEMMGEPITNGARVSLGRELATAGWKKHPGRLMGTRVNYWLLPNEVRAAPQQKGIPRALLPQQHARA